MKIKIAGLFIFILGVFIGGCSIYLIFHTSNNQVSQNKFSFNELLMYSQTEIDIGSNACEGDNNKTVGEVLSHILETNFANQINRVSLNCIEPFCWVGVSDCNPWESSECGSRMLRFELDADEHLVPSSFQCIDTP